MKKQLAKSMTVRQVYKGKIMNGLLSALDGAIISPENQKRLIVICSGLADAMLKEDETHTNSLS